MSQEPVDPDAASDPTRYDPLAIEEPIARRWFEDGTYSTSPSAADPPTYLLTMFPYPSGDLHMGHAEIFSIHDALVRQRRMLGERVLNPIGWDAFGLPAENAARKRGIDPRTWTYANIEEQAASIARLGYSFDWSTRLNTCDPTYYRWTQWVFVQLMKAGLADRRAGLVNWCPGCETVLANEQVIDGRCERSDDLVVRRPTGAVVPAHLQLRPAAARRPDRPGLARPGEEHPAQLDRALGGGDPAVPRWPAPTRRSRSTPLGPTPCSAPPTRCSRRSTRWCWRTWATTPSSRPSVPT